MSSASSHLERLLPSLHELLSAHPLEACAPSSAAPPRRSSTGLYREGSDGSCHNDATRPSANATSSLGCDPPWAALAIIEESYARWRQCITVWRKAIGNDSVFLTLLLHTGCLWCPNYAALHRVKRGLSTRGEQQRQSARTVPAANEKVSAGAGKAAAEGEQGRNVLLSRVNSLANAPFSTAVRRRGKRGSRVVAEAAAHSVYALAAAAEAHAEMAAACPASLWALHVLHFLRVEEVCSVSFASSSSSSSSAQKSGGQGDAVEPSPAPSSCVSSSPHSDSGDSSEGELTIARNNAGPSCSGSHRSQSSTESDRVGGDRTSDAEEVCVMRGRTPGAGRGGRGRRSQAGGGQRGIKRPRGKGRGERHRAASTNGRGKKPRLHSREGAREAHSSLNAPERQWVASSSLLPKLPHKESNGGGGAKHLGSTLAAVLSALQQQEQQRASAHRRDELVGDGAKNEGEERRRDSEGGLGRRSAAHHCGTGTLHTASATAEEKHALLLRAIITLVSEEEPLVQRVATALVNEWVDFMSVEASASPSCDTAVFSGGGGAGRGTVGSARAPSYAGADTPEQALRRRRMCDARHYWLSCLLKMVAYLDGVHSALREENAHIGAVLARQGIAPQDAEDIFTKSLPAIFNCALVEEVLRSAAAALPASQPFALTAWAAPPSLACTHATPTVRLWMPPPVLLLPFHLIGRGSAFGVWVPASAASVGCPPALPAARTPARAQGRFVPCVVESHGLYLSAEPHVDGAAQRPSAKAQDAEHCRLGFVVRCARSESLLESRHLASLDHLLPILHAPSVASQLTADGDRRLDQPHAQPSLRWWSCLLNETAGCPRMDLYVARTLFMLPIPAQSTLDGTTKHTGCAERVNADANACAVTADEAHYVGTRTKSTPGALKPPSVTVGIGRRPRGGFRRRPTMSAEEQAVRHEHPLLYHAMRAHLRAERSAFKAGSGDSQNGYGELLLLYGHPCGEEVTALRHMGFTVRTGSHHSLGRSTGPSSVSSVTGLGSDGGGGSGRLTLARDALGTTLEGMYLIARRVLGLQGLFVSSTPAPTTPAADTGVETRVRGTGGPSVAGSAALGGGGPCMSAKGSTCPNAAAVRISPETEREALGTVAATLALTCLVLAHNLLDDLLEQPFLVLWTTELASFTLDVSLLMPRPLSGLLKADGLAMALLLQPAQSLLLVVGLAATLVTREAHMAAASTRGGRGRGNCGTPSASKSGAPQWYPWWSAFRAAVLRDTELPSCLYSGVWPILESAEDTLAACLAEARRDASGERHTSDGKRGRPSLVAGSSSREEGMPAGAPVPSPSRGGRRGGAGGGRRVLSLAGPSFSAAAGLPSVTNVRGTSSSTRSNANPCRSSIDQAAPHGRRLLLTASPADSVVSCGAGSVVPKSDPYVPRRLCGDAVLCQDDGIRSASTEMDAPHAAARGLLFAQGVSVMPGNEMALLASSSAHTSTAPPASRMFSLSLTRAALLPQLTTVVASALWASLEAEEMHWPAEAA
ncbi:hypothetical protein LSCM1_07833 [Leishmania martiniquensis]|uniref:Uncharacterized protein n=1 Tax=Leishmania martiniquensis TaxID=1580590 RepID=A0A836H469_9TRYP|nr:hypothetical protein LSCM1_07833 [Leishmania martiniquensis]